MQIDFPWHFDSRGRTAEAAAEEHIRDMIEQVLFTSTGERVNRPTFGTNLSQLVFAPNSSELASTTQFLVQGALQKWMGDLIRVESLQVDNQDATITVTVQYVVLQSQKRYVAKYVRES